MNVKVQNTEKNVVELEIEVDASKFEEGMQKSFLKNAKKFSIPGFRKGKAPRKLIERYYGESVFYEDAVDFVCPEAYEEAIKQNDIHPVDRPEIDIKQIGEGKNLIFTARVTVKPEVELGDYKGVEVKRVDAAVTDEDVEKELQKAAEKNSRLVTIEDRGIQNGDIAVVDFEGFINGEGFEGGKESDYSLTIGSSSFIPGFDEQLIGAKTGDEVDVNVTFPEDYGNKELAGKQASFKVKVKEIKVKETPAIDDEFAKDVSEFDTLEAYKADIRKKLTEKAEQRAKNELENRVVEKVVENASVDIPDVMIEKQIDSMVRNVESSLFYQGMKLDTYLKISGLDMDKLREKFRERAAKEVKSQLVLEKIRQVENIETTEKEIDEEIDRLSKIYLKSREEIKKDLADEKMEYIKDEIALRKTVEMLVANATIVEE